MSHTDAKAMAGSVCPMQNMACSHLNGIESLHLSRNNWVQNIKVQMERDVKGSDRGRNHH